MGEAQPVGTVITGSPTDVRATASVPAPGLAPAAVAARVAALLVSPVHRYAGRPGDGPAQDSGTDDDTGTDTDTRGVELVDAVEIRAGFGIVGDRYAGRRAHRDASVTLQSLEALDAVSATLGFRPGTIGLERTRRNVLLSGVDIDAWIGRIVELDDGGGAPVVLALNRPARPCAWMDVRIAPGARRALRGAGGVRCTPLTDGRLRVGTVTVRVLDRAALRPGTLTPGTLTPGTLPTR